MALFSSVFFSAFIVFSLSEASSYAHRNKNKTAAFSAVNAAVSEGGGEWVLLQKSIGVSAMHMQLLKNNRVIIFDRTNMGPSNLTFPKDKEYCLNYTIHNKPELVTDCTAHSLSYDVASNTIRPLVVRSDTWCSSGAVDPSGTLIQTGGFGNGSRSIRKVPACDDDTCDWTEEQQVNLVENRWYASSQILPDGRAVVIGGRHVFSYEFYPKADGMSSEKYHLRFLVDTYDEKEENNLYPFLHLLPDGNLFLFANNRSILLDYNNNRVVKEFPVMPGGVKRNYPSTGSSVLLPLKMNGKLDGSGLPEAEVLICGGAHIGAFTRTKDKVFVGASTSCGRITVTDPDPKWVMETLPMPRVMPDMLLLPTGDVIIINGASKGTAGWENAINPVLNPVLYKTYEPNADSRFITLNPSSIPRMYHSSAVLLPDGRVLVGGSNPHERYMFRAEFPTDLSLEAYNPPYLSPIFASLRPTIGSVESRTKTVSYGQSFGVKFQLPVYTNDSAKFSVALVTPSFTTHSFAMSQRMVVLDIVRFKHLYTRYKKPSAKYDYKIVARGPPKNTVAPPGYYMLFVIQAGIPSQATWVRVQ